MVTGRLHENRVVPNNLNAIILENGWKEPPVHTGQLNTVFGTLIFFNGHKHEFCARDCRRGYISMSDFFFFLFFCWIFNIPINVRK